MFGVRLCGALLASTVIEVVPVLRTTFRLACSPAVPNARVDQDVITPAGTL